MSNLVQGLVYDRAPYSDDRFNILLALADWANDDGRSCYPSLIKLARKARVSYRNTIYSIQKLENERINGEPMLNVTRHKKKGLANEYFINVPLLESLPYYWPESLQNRVQPLHPSVLKKAVEKTQLKGATSGKNRVQSRVQPKGAMVAPHPSCHASIMNQPPLDATVNHDGGETVENFQENLFPDLSPAELVEFAGAPSLPIGGRYVRDETDPGGWSQVEVMEAYKDMVPHALSNDDRKELQKIRDFPFSTQLTIYVMHKTKAKAGSPPGSMKYFRIALERLWIDCSIAIAKVRDETYSMTREQAFWKLNDAVLKEIALWECRLGRS